MIKKWLDLVNLGMAALFAFLVVSAGMLEWSRPNHIPLPEVNEHKTTLPKRSFTQTQEAYNTIGEPVLALEYHPPRLQLPDLRQQINYYGQNNRPDVSANNSLLHFGIAKGTDTKNTEMSSIASNQPLYLIYERDEGAGHYRFSPRNEKTALWIEADAIDKDANIHVHMLDENDEEVKSPEAYANFQLKEKEFSRYGGAPWEIGKWRVDGTLLARQRARWFGVDKFLERHGGEEFADIADKNRVDFGDKDDVYSVYLGEGSALIWDGARWKTVIPGEKSRGYPLLVVKKVEDRLMNLELWDPDGNKKIALNLLKSMETWVPTNIQKDFKFLGARTRSQFVFEIDDEKMLLSPHDWLLLTDDGWKKLNSPEEIDAYVDRNEIGTLFVFDGIDRLGDQQVLKGALYNPSRTQVEELELPVQKDGLVYHQVEKGDKKKTKEAWRGKIEQTPIVDGRQQVSRDKNDATPSS